MFFCKGYFHTSTSITLTIACYHLDHVWREREREREKERSVSDAWAVSHSKNFDCANQSRKKTKQNWGGDFKAE